MGFIDTIKARAKRQKTIVLPESEDRRTYEAAAQILKEGNLQIIILVGSEEAVKKGSEGLDVSKVMLTRLRPDKT